MTDIDTQKQQPDIPDEAAASAAPLASPGEMLRTAREARGLSQAELAEAAKLPQATIVSLECDDFEVLKEPVYVRGYYRKCALTLEADVDAIVGAYERKARPAAPALPDKIPVVSGGGQSLLRRLLRGVMVLLLLGLLAAAGWWLLQPPGTAPGDDFAVFDDVSDDRSALDSAVSDTDSADAAANDDAEAAATTEVAEEPAPATESAPATGAEPGQPDQVIASSDTEAGAAPTLELRFDDESWLRVRDANDQTLVNELISAGARERIEGEPPLELFVGYAPGVEVVWRGEAVSLDDATRSNNTALVSLE